MMNFNGLTKEAKVELSQILFTVARDPRWRDKQELILMVREAVMSEVRTHVANDSQNREICKAPLGFMGPFCKRELNLAGFETAKDVEVEFVNKNAKYDKVTMHAVGKINEVDNNK